MLASVFIQLSPASDQWVVSLALENDGCSLMPASGRRHGTDQRTFTLCVALKDHDLDGSISCATTAAPRR
jgi:hypothetical protein